MILSGSKKSRRGWLTKERQVGITIDSVVNQITTAESRRQPAAYHLNCLSERGYGILLNKEPP